MEEEDGGWSRGGSGRRQLIGSGGIPMFAAAAFGEATFSTWTVLIVVCPLTAPPPQMFGEKSSLTCNVEPCAVFCMLLGFLGDTLCVWLTRRAKLNLDKTSTLKVKQWKLCQSVFAASLHSVTYTHAL